MTLEQQLVAKVMKDVNLSGGNKVKNKGEKSLVGQVRKKNQQSSPEKKGTMKFLKLNKRKNTTDNN